MSSPKIRYFLTSLAAALFYAAIVAVYVNASPPENIPLAGLPLKEDFDAPPVEIELEEEVVAEPTLTASPPTVNPIETITPLPTNTPDETQADTPAGIGGMPTNRFRQFTPNQFNDLFYQADLPGLIKLNTPPPVTGHPQADQRLKTLAENLGYRLQSVPSVPLEMDDDLELQPAAANAWRDLKLNAAKAGISLGLVSGFRPVEYQKDLFLTRLNATSGKLVTPADIVSGNKDADILKVLSHTALPGYSKHHTGYAIDITDIDSGLHFTRFKVTAGYRWLSANNFYEAKRSGFIPSYPEGADNLGPAPEAWELVYVGTEMLSGEE